MRIMLDLDGCFFNFGDSVHRYLCHIGKAHLWKSGPTPKPFWNFFEDWGWDVKDFVKFCNDGVDDGFIFAGPMREGGKEAWDRIVATGNEIIVITDRSFGSTPRSSERNTYEWLEQHDLYYDELWFSADKTVTQTDMAVDDKISNYDALVAAGTNTYLINRAWNDQVDMRNRVDSVLDFAAAVERATADGFVDLNLV